MKRFLASAVLLISMGTFSACAHHAHDGKMSCGGDSKCADCAKGQCKVDMGADKAASEKCDGHCDSK